MKIISWNCNGAFRRKINELLSFEADIFIIQECENPQLAQYPVEIIDLFNFRWIGENKNKGLGIFIRKDWDIKVLDWSNVYQDKEVRYFLPCRINNSFNLLGVWAHSNNSPTFGYIGQFWKYIQINKEKFENTIIAGDFNSNSIWDKWDRWWNHSDVIKELDDINIKSIYHTHHNEDQGKESNPTFFLQRNRNKPYHIDYIFADKNLYNASSLYIGDANKWLTLSDHLPIIVEFQT